MVRYSSASSSFKTIVDQSDLIPACCECTALKLPPCVLARFGAATFGAVLCVDGRSLRYLLDRPRPPGKPAQRPHRIALSDFGAEYPRLSGPISRLDDHPELLYEQHVYWRDVMGLGEWFEDRVDARALKAAAKILDDIIARSAADSAFFRRYGEMVGQAMDGLWPCSQPDPAAYIFEIRMELCRMQSAQIFEMACKLQKLAQNFRKNGLDDAAIGTALLSQWVNVVSIAEKRRGSSALEALLLVQRYEDAIATMLAELGPAPSLARIV